MRKFSSILMSFFLCVFSMQCLYSSDEAGWDTISDQQIQSCLSADTFQNLPLLYSYDHQNWELRIVFNAQREKIALSNGRPSMLQFYYGVFARDKIPESLEKHLRVLVQSQLNSTSGGQWAIASSINGMSFIDYLDGATGIEGTAKISTDLR